MFFVPFWILLGVMAILGGIVLYIRKPEWTDLFVYIAAVALVMSSDMIYCKQLQLYHYVSFEYKGWYSFWANIIIIPSFALIFTKFIPERKKFFLLYITLWTIGGTLFELFVTGPMGIVLYMKWHVIPYSLIGAFVYLYLVYRFRNFVTGLLKRGYTGKANS